MLGNLKINVIIVGFLSLAVFLVIGDWLEKIHLFRLPTGSRHLMMVGVVFLVYLVSGTAFRLQKRYLVYIAILVGYLALNFVFLQGSSRFNFLLGTVFTFLFVFIFLFSSNIPTTERTLVKLFQLLVLFIFILAVFPMSQGLIQGTNLRWIPGAFREVGALGATMNIGAILSLALFIITKKKIYLFFAVFFTLGVLMATLKKTMITNIVCWTYFFYKFSGSKLRRRVVPLLIISIIALLPIIGRDLVDNVGTNVDYLNTVGSSDHVRIGMYIASYNIATDYFPFGSGMGTFASLPSITGGYSDLYYKYGVAYIGSNSPSDVALGAHTLFDTFWPHIIAELGFIGSLLYLLIWFFPAAVTWRNLKNNTTPFVNGVSFYLVLVVFMMFNEGFTLYTPEVPSFILFHAGITGLCFFHVIKSKKKSVTYE